MCDETKSEELSEASLEFLKSLYFDATTTIRHYDSLRATFTQIFASLLAMFSGVVTAATAIQGIVDILLPTAASILAVLSIISLLVVLKIGSLITFQRKRASAAMKRYEIATNGYSFDSINADARTFSSDSFSARLSLGRLWAGIFVVLLFVNAMVLLFSITR